MRNSNPKQRLDIYLNDHLAGATVGVEMARRLRSSNEGDPVFGGPTAEICSEIEADREALEGMMDHLGISRDPFKPRAAWAAEKLGRLKPNGQIAGYSPLSRLIELEMLCIGITGKLQMWAALRDTVGERLDEFDFQALAERADRQRSTVEDLHRAAAREALPAGETSGTG